tara:strand:+ start:427 stop:798 length:372 start_codon:yes stop_codon:yes gene_type:complete
MSTQPSEVEKFNIENYKIKTENQKFTITIREDEFDVTIRPMTWQVKNDLVSNCMEFDGKGSSTFDSSKYVREVLKTIIIEAPWGETTDEFLDSINTELGTALEQVVPSAMDTTFTEVNVVKKE